MRLYTRKLWKKSKRYFLIDVFYFFLKFFRVLIKIIVLKINDFEISILWTIKCYIKTS